MRTESRKRHWSRRLAFTVATYAVLGLAAECACRIHYRKKGWPKMHKAHPDLGWVNRPGWHGVYQHWQMHLNNLGLRDPEDVVAKTPNERRILLLGDSIVFGYEVGFEDTCGEQLERMLNDSERQDLVYRVLNAGVLGYNTVQEARLFRLKGTRLDPDVVVVGYCLNDHVPATLDVARMLHVHNTSANRVNEFCLEHSAAYFFMVKAFHRYRKKLHRTEADGTFGTNVILTEEPYRRVREALTEICALAGARQCPVILAVFPTKPQLASEPLSLAPQNRLEALVEGLDLCWLDLAPVYQAHRNESLYLGVEEVHPNPRGHYLAAAEVFRLIEEKALLGPP